MGCYPIHELLNKAHFKKKKKERERTEGKRLEAEDQQRAYRGDPGFQAQAFGLCCSTSCEFKSASSGRPADTPGWLSKCFLETLLGSLLPSVPATLSTNTNG